MDKKPSVQLDDIRNTPNNKPDRALNDASTAWKIANNSEESMLSRKWKKPSETMMLVNHFISEGMTPKEVLTHMLPQYAMPSTMTDELAVQVIFEMFSERRTREKLPEYNTFDQGVELFRTRRNILVLTGAGVSVSCGIPDFRSANGIYARLYKDFPELPDPQAMFDIDFFRKDPAPFFSFAKEIFPGQFKPSVSHMFIKFLEESGQLLRNYTQNIDTLEQIAGITRVIDCHGSFARSTCVDCGREVNSDEIKADVFAQRVAYCTNCKSGVMKPNIVFFGEDLGAKFHEAMADDHDKVDLLVVIGSSLKVHPVALIPFNIAPNVPQILINREQLTRYDADIKLLGNCDEIVLALCLAIGGDIRRKMLNELETRPDEFPEFLAEFHAAVQKDDAVLPRILSVDDFKRSVTTQRGGDSITTTEKNLSEKHPYGVDDGQQTSAKRARLDVVVAQKDQIILTTANILPQVVAASKSDETEDNEVVSSFSNRPETTTSTTNSSLALSSEFVSSSSVSFDTANSNATTTKTTNLSVIESTSDCDPHDQLITSTTSTAITINESNNDEDNETMWESNYVDVSSVLPFNSTLYIPSNLNVFKGVELYYDRDSEAFCRRPGPMVTRLLDDCGEPSGCRDIVYSTDSSDGEEESISAEDDDSSQSSSAFSKTKSVPVGMKYSDHSAERTSISDSSTGEFPSTTTRSADYAELADELNGRANSCPVNFFPNVTLEDCEAILNYGELSRPAN